MTTKTETVAKHILQLAAEKLVVDGRPRKRPGKQRLETSGVRTSTLGAIKWASKQVNATKTQQNAATTLAADAILDGTGFWPSTCDWSNKNILDEFDDVEADTRFIVRLLTKASKAK